MGILSAVLLDMLQEQFRHETSNALRYTSRSSWTRYRGLESTADFFQQEAEGEYAHAAKVRGWIEARNCALVPEPYNYTDSSAFPDYASLFVSSQEIERNTTDRLNAIYAMALTERDYMLVTAVSELVHEQIEEENLYQTIIDRISTRGQDAASVHDIDMWIGERFVK